MGGRNLGVVLAILVGACANNAPEKDAPVPLAESSAGPAGDGVQTTNFSGPGLVCGFGFAIVLDGEERLTQVDRLMDFLTYQLVSEDKSAVIYAGNAPQESDALVETGEGYPAYVALHLGSGGYTKAMADRILVAENLPSACKEQFGS